MTRAKALVTTLVMTGALLLSGCSSSTSATKPSTGSDTTTATSVAAQVSTILATVGTETQTLTEKADWSVLGHDYGLAASQLEALAYPAGADSAAKGTVAVLRKLQRDATAVPASGTAALLGDIANLQAEGATLRSALGIAPASAS